jgi:BRCT domain type II-containing protein
MSSPVTGCDEAVVMSPGKVTRKASMLSRIPQEASHGQRDLVQGLIQQWVDKRGSEELLLALVALVEHLGIKVRTINQSTPNHTTCQGQHDKTSPVKERAKGNVLVGKRFVLSGTWPRRGRGEGLAVGKEAIRAIIKKYGGSVPSGYSCLTNALVIGVDPGPKKVLDAHQHGIIIIDLTHPNDIIYGRVSELSNFHNTAYPVAAMSILDKNNIQVQHPLQEPDTLP